MRPREMTYKVLQWQMTYTSLEAGIRVTGVFPFLFDLKAHGQRSV